MSTEISVDIAVDIATDISVDITHSKQDPIFFASFVTADGKGGENVALEVNSRSFNFHRDYSNLPALSNVGELSWN